MLCPKCNTEVEAFYRKKRSIWLACPSCKRPVMKTTEAPADAKVTEVDRYPWEEVEKGKVISEGLFEAPKEPSEIVAEILSEYGCSEEFIKTVARYIERKGYFDAQWLFNLLLRARTGRRWTEEEAFLAVDEIVSAIESERKKAESTGRPFPITVVGFTTRPIQYPSTLVPPAPPQYQYQYAVPPQPTTPQPIQTQPPTPQPIQYYQPQPVQQQLTREAIERLFEEKLQKALAEKRVTDEIGELRKKVTEEIPKMIDEKTTALQKSIMEMVSGRLDKIEGMISSLKQPAPRVEEEITKKDLEILQERIEKSYLERMIDTERKVLEERLKALEEKIEEKKKPIVPPPSEGYKEDSFRLVADTIKTLVKPGEWYPGKAVAEVLVRLIPTEKAPPERKEIPGEKSIAEKVKEAGGVVE